MQIQQRERDQSQVFVNTTTLTEVISLTDTFLSGEKNCWVIWDIGYTLSMPALVRDGKTCPISKKNLMEALSEINDTVLFDRMHATSIFFPRILIDKDAPKIIKELRARKLKTFALTAALGRENLRQLRYSRLKTMGIDFSDAFDFSEVLLDNIASYTGYRSGYSNGILYANGELGPDCNKGFVLTSFMNKIGQKPTHIVFIDDRKKNLEDLQKTFENSEIKFLGILYTDKREYKEVPVDIIRKELTKLLSGSVL